MCWTLSGLEAGISWSHSLTNLLTFKIKSLFENMIPLTVALRRRVYRHGTEYSYLSLIKTKGETTNCGLYMKWKNKHRPKFRTGKDKKISVRVWRDELISSFQYFIFWYEKKQFPVRARLVLCHFLLSITIAAFFILHFVLVLWNLAIKLRFLAGAFCRFIQ